MKAQMDMARVMMEHIRREFPDMELRSAQTIAMAEEAGEAVGAARRYMGLARRSGTKKELEEEIADTIITALGLAYVFDINAETAVQKKFQKIFTRGWRE